MSRLPSIYADPALYDLVHAEGTDDEVWFLAHLAEIHGCGAKTALEPACGTGRYLAGLLRRGWTVEGYDLAPGMLAFTRKRLAGWGKRVKLARGEMSSYRPKRRFGLIFNVLSTFRHLMTEKDALAHLTLMAGALEPGGLFVLGLDLSIYGQDEPDEEVYECRQGGRTAKHVLMSIPAEPGTRRERIINFVTTPKGKKEAVLESSYDLRSYSAAEAAALIEKSPLRIEAVYGYDGRDAVLDGPERALWLVLKTKA
ncbi:MAG: class I SAM-dependent methyltransferase [Elusimicrobiota bacterium]|nr:class I SAM-dependent methyltransferase [Elusimicrobiota bacterium]